MPEIQPNIPQRAQLQYPMDAQSKGALRLALEDVEKDVIRKRNRVPITLASGATSFGINSDYMVITASAAVTIATIVGGREGQVLTLQFADANTTITDTSTGAVDTVNLNSAFTSTANTVLQLLHDGTSWREVARSSSGSPGGSDTQVQFNDGGAFGGDADFTWNKTTNILNVGSISNNGIISTPNQTTTDVNGRNLTIQTGNGNGTGEGGIITIEAGDGGATAAAGGDISITAGDGTTLGGGGNGGDMDISAGAAGSASNVSGNMKIHGGTSAVTDGVGGNITLRMGGGGGGTGIDGYIEIDTQTYQGVIRRYFTRTTTTDATQTSLYVGGTVLPGSSFFFNTEIKAIRTGGSAGTAEDSAAYIRRALYKRVGTAAPTLVGSIQDDFTAEDQVGWDATFIISGNSIQIGVTGAINNNITWSADTKVIRL